MLKEVAEVINVYSDKAVIKFKRSQMCSCCKTRSLCNKNDGKLIIDRAKFKLKAGDKVEVGIEPRKTVLATLITFLVPAAIFIFGLIIFRSRGELLSFLLALILLAVYYIAVKILVGDNNNYFKLKLLAKA